MKTKTIRALPSIVMCALCAQTQAAEPVPVAAGPAASGSFALSAEAGTLGAGASAWYTLSDSFTLSAGYNGLGYDHDLTTSDVDYAGKLKLSNIPVMLNWHPFKGTFRLAAGLVVGKNNVEVTGRPSGVATYRINGTTYTAAQVGSLKGIAKFADGTMPYVGLGWAKTPKRTGFAVLVDLGVLFTDSPKVTLASSGPISTDATFQANLAREVKRVNDEVAFANVYPVARFGLMYRF